MREHCNLCPRNCGLSGADADFCGVGDRILVARAALHMFEEPAISGDKGSGTIFFSGCNLRCVFCQNYEISHLCEGEEVTVQRLAEIMKELTVAGAHNINLVNPGHYVPTIKRALAIFRPDVPIVYNTNAYERVAAVQLLKDCADVYLPDLKFFSPEVSEKYAGAADYFEVASKAVCEMAKQCGQLLIEGGLIKKGMIVRHLILPGNIKDSFKILDWIADNLPKDVLVSIMSQYTPYGLSGNYLEINRKLTTYEYNKVLDYAVKKGIKGYSQDGASARADYIPKFDFTGVRKSAAPDETAAAREAPSGESESDEDGQC